MSLFLASPRNQRRTKKKEITSGRPAINGISCPISIRKYTENKKRLSRVEKTMEESAPLCIEECAEQQHSESIVEQTDTSSLGEQRRKCLDE